MGIFKRFRTMVSANLNKAIDDMEDPIAMLDEHIRNMQVEYARVKRDMAEVMGIAKGVERRITSCEKEIDTLDCYIKQAVADGNTDDARTLMAEKCLREDELGELKSSLLVAQGNVTKMHDLHSSLAEDIKCATEKRNILKSKVTVADTEYTVNKASLGCSKVSSALADFTRLEDKINARFDSALALEYIESSSEETGIDSLKNKYRSRLYSERVDSALASYLPANV